MFSAKKTDLNQFIVDAKKLQSKHEPLIDSHVLQILHDNNIRLKMETYDSDVYDTCKPVVVFIHGNSSSKKVFDEQIKYFLSQNYRVIAIDLLGHGRSTKISTIKKLSEADRLTLCEAFYNPYAMIAEVSELLKSKRIQNAHLIGWSLGGHIAYGVAAENPELVATIITIGSPPVMFSQAGMKKGFAKWFITNLVPQWINNPVPTPRNEAIDICNHEGFKNEDESLVRDMIIADPYMRKYLFFKLNEYDAEKHLGSTLDGEQFVQTTEIPIYLIVGEKDHGVDSNYIAGWRNKLKNSNSKVEVVKDAPHAVFKADAQTYCKITESFIRQTIEKASLRPH